MLSLPRMAPLPLLVSLTLSLALPLGSGIGRVDTSSPVARVSDTRSRVLADRVQIGAFVKGMQAEPGRLDGFERMIGARVDIASYYYGFGDVFPAQPERRLSDGGRRTILLSWDMGPTRFSEWSHGQHDRYLDRIARAARNYPNPVYVRPWPEMNGDWQSFQPTPDGRRPNGGTYQQFKDAWRHVVTYLRARGASNLRWVFNPTADTYGETTPARAIWPGRRYVDVLGMDGFNWGTDEAWGRWRTFPDIFRTQYAKLTALHPTAPVWICETASKEPQAHDGAPVDRAHDKASWVRNMLSFRGMPRLKALVWFQAKKERDWRINSSRGSLKAFRSAIHSA